MVTLDEFRRWLQGEDIYGLPARGLGDSLAVRFIPKGKYEIQTDGLDARLKFGKHKDKLVSRMAATSSGCDYLAWMLGQEFPPELKDAIEYQVEKQKTLRRKMKGGRR